MPDDGGGGGGPRPWQEDVEPCLRSRVVEKIVRNLARICEGQLDPSQDLNRVAATYEQKTFTEAHSKDEYIRRISQKLVHLEKKGQPVPRATSGLQKQIQMGCHVQPINAVQEIHGGNSSITAMSQAASTISPGRRSCQLQSPPMTPAGSSLVPNQHMVYPFAPSMHSEVKQEQPDIVVKPNQILSSPPTSVVTPLAPGVQHSQMIQSVPTQNQKQLPAMQRQPTTISGCNLTSVVQPQGQPVVQPNGQQNHLCRPNARGISMLPQQQMMMNQQGLLGVNQQHMDGQRYQMLLAQQANVAKVQTRHPGGHNNQHNAGQTVGLQSPLNTYKQEALKKQIKMEPEYKALPQQLITVSQESGLLCAIPQALATMGSAREVDWRDEMFQQIKPLKNAYLSELVEFDHVLVVPKITKKQFESLSKDKTEQYRYRVNLKKKTRVMLNFLQFQKNSITENLRGQLPMFLKTIQDLIGLYRKSKDRKAEVARGRQSQISREQPQIINLTGDPTPSSGGTSTQQKQQQPVDSQSRQNVLTRTPAVPQQNHSNLLLGVASSCFPEKSPGSLQSMPTNKLQECCTPSPVTKSGAVKVSSPSASVKSISPSPVAKWSAVKVASPSATVKSTSPSPVAKSSAAKVALPSASMKSTSSSPVAKQGIVKTGSPAALVKSTVPSPIAKPGVGKGGSSSASVKSTPFAKSGVIQATSPHASMKSTLSSPVTNSGIVPVASPCTSVKSTSSENVASLSALLLQNNAVAATAGGAAETAAINVSKQVIARNVSETVDCQVEDQEHGGDKTPVAKNPIDRLLDAVRSSSPAVLRSSANSIFSVVSINDRVPHMEIGAFQDWAFFSQQSGSSPENKMKRIFETTSSVPESPPLSSMDGSCVTFDCDALEVESDAERGAKRQKTQNAQDALRDEINSANSMLFDTVISIAGDNRTDGITSSSGGTLIKLSYTAMSHSPGLKSLFATSGMSIVMPVKLLVPVDYPRSSPVFVDDQREEQLRKRSSDISRKVDMEFRHALYSLPEPRSIGKMARAWDSCVRRAVMEFAQQHGGGTFSSRYGRWERCSGA